MLPDGTNANDMSTFYLMMWNALDVWVTHTSILADETDVLYMSMFLAMIQQQFEAYVRW